MKNPKGEVLDLASIYRFPPVAPLSHSPDLRHTRSCYRLYCQHFQQRMDQPRKSANPVRGHLNRTNKSCAVPVTPENLVSRDGFDVPSHVSPIIRHTQAEFRRTHGIFPLCTTASPYTVNRHRASPECSGYAIAYRWRSLPRIHRHRASSPQGSSSRGCCLFRCHPGPAFVRLLFSHTQYWY